MNMITALSSTNQVCDESVSFNTFKNDIEGLLEYIAEGLPVLKLEELESSRGISFPTSLRSACMKGKDSLDQLSEIFEFDDALIKEVMNYVLGEALDRIEGYEIDEIFIEELFYKYY